MSNGNGASKGNRAKQRVTVFLNPDLLKHAKAEAIIEGRTLTVLIEKALIDYLPHEIIIKKPTL